jgi:DDE superfamily endonuclease
VFPPPIISNKELSDDIKRLNFYVSTLQQQIKDQARTIEQLEKAKELREKKIGIHINISSLEDRVDWFRTKEKNIHQELMGELRKKITIDTNNPHIKCTKDLLLDLLFFTFASGLSFETISKGFYGTDGKTVSSRTISRWFDQVLTDLLPWSKEQVYFLTDEEWIKDSSKIYSQEKYQHFWQTLFYFVDGSVIETCDSSDPLTSRTFRNGKHSISAIVFFVVVSPRGRIVYVSERFREGTVHDKTHWEDEKVTQQLAKAYESGQVTLNGITYQREMGGDKAYPHMSKPGGWRVRVTKTAEETKDVGTDGQEKGPKACDAKLQDVFFDPSMARLRGVVERTIGKVKSWPIFQNPKACSTLMRTYKMVWFSCALVNWYMLKLDMQQI